MFAINQLLANILTTQGGSVNFDPPFFLSPIFLGLYIATGIIENKGLLISSILGDYQIPSDALCGIPKYYPHVLW